MKRFAASLISALIAHVAIAQSLPKGNPSELGFSPEKLDAISTTLKTDIGKNMIPGAVILVMRHGKVAMFEADGVRDPGTKEAMTTDTIFRIYSMSKAITTTAAMMLVEQGKLSLTDPVSKYIPSFAHMKVIVPKPDPNGGKPTTELVDAKNQITIADLMRHTSGITYGFFGQSAQKSAYNDGGVMAGDPTNEEFAERIAKLPLGTEPGTTWDYSHSTDVLGRVVEVVSKKSLYEFEKDNLLKPLGMSDTSFYVNDKAKQPRIAEPFPNDRTIGVGATFGDPRVTGKWESGGGGMMSTATDYTVFLQMMLHNGKAGGKQYLKESTVADMTSDHTQGIKRTALYLPGAAYGFGWGFAVRTGDDMPNNRGTVGDYTWNGVGGTHFWVDPKKDMTVVFMIQSVRQRPRYMALIRNMVYDAIVQ